MSGPRISIICSITHAFPLERWCVTISIPSWAREKLCASSFWSRCIESLNFSKDQTCHVEPIAHCKPTLPVLPGCVIVELLETATYTHRLAYFSSWCRHSLPRCRDQRCSWGCGRISPDWEQIFFKPMNPWKSGWNCISKSLRQHWFDYLSSLIIVFISLTMQMKRDL